MSKLKKPQAWEISDTLWKKIEPLIPPVVRNKKQKYQRRPGGGRKPLDAKKIFSGIVYILRTGIQWKAVPQEKYGSGSALHRHFTRWVAQGFFQKIWQAGLLEYDELKGIAWEWQSADGATNKAPLAQEKVGKNPTDRGKKWGQAKSAGR